MLLWRNLPSIKIPFVKLITISAFIICASGPWHDGKDVKFSLPFIFVKKGVLVVLAHTVAHAYLCEDILRLAGILLYLTADIGHVHPEDLIIRLGLGAP